ncbi:hypothetical protein ALC62_01076 [Cyphomyrmex costatus]|uniref:Uncharacterized protein n=1 Tax=Cyphomyrmex costatus TaxID=456900 RepID=A0A195D4R4_9HYME|nr:hypothetical protein ALC62_01076 [Cyphomyrmex costatus]
MLTHVFFQERLTNAKLECKGPMCPPSSFDVSLSIHTSNGANRNLIISGSKTCYIAHVRIGASTETEDAYQKLICERLHKYSDRLLHYYLGLRIQRSKRITMSIRISANNARVCLFAVCGHGIRKKQKLAHSLHRTFLSRPTFSGSHLFCLTHTRGNRTRMYRNVQTSSFLLATSPRYHFQTRSRSSSDRSFPRRIIDKLRGERSYRGPLPFLFAFNFTIFSPNARLLRLEPALLTTSSRCRPFATSRTSTQHPVAFTADPGVSAGRQFHSSQNCTQPPTCIYRFPITFHLVVVTVRQDDIIETVPTQLETAYLDLSPSATCSNISEDGLTLSTPMYRRNLDIYRTMCTYVSVPDPLARCKL